VGRYIVRIDRSSLILMGLKVGDIVVVTGNNGRKTAAKCLDSMLLEFESIIRMDKVMRYNLGMQIDDIIDSKSVAKANNIYSSNSHTYKEEIVLEPLTMGIPASVDEQYVARALEGVPVVKGQAVLVPYYGGSWFQYAVLDIRKATGMEEEEKTEILASEISVMVGPDTSIIFEGKAG
jgi:transitional endoplasmic reticulum ATPase